MAMSHACCQKVAGLLLQICGFTVPRGYGRGILNLKSGPLSPGEPLRLPVFKGARPSGLPPSCTRAWTASACCPCQLPCMTCCRAVQATSQRGWAGCHARFARP